MSSLRPRCRPAMRLAPSVLVGILLLTAGATASHAQNDSGQPKTKKSTSTAKSKEKDPAAVTFESLSFASAPAAGAAATEKTYAYQSPAGQERLSKVVIAAKANYRERGVLDERIQPRLEQREVVRRNLETATAAANNAQSFIQKTTPQIRNLRNQLAMSKDFQQIALYRDQINSLQLQVDDASRVLMTSGQQVNALTPELRTLNSDISTLDLERQKLWKSLQTDRQEWLNVCEPMRKYANADFDLLRKDLDEWVQVDVLWPDALVWSVLCSFELGDDHAAAESFTKAQEARLKLGLPKAWSQGPALQALLSLRIAEQRGKTTNLVQEAVSIAGKSKTPDWTTFFLVGRVSAEKDVWAVKGKTYLERALKIEPDATCAELWLARLMTTTSNETVQNPSEGTKLLEARWNASSQNSWRLGHALVVAYDASKREKDARELWETVLRIAPEAEHDNLAKMRDVAASRRGGSSGAGQ